MNSRLKKQIALAGIIVLAAAASGLAGKVEVGKNKFTGAAIYMKTGTHPATADYRGRKAEVKPDTNELAKAKALMATLKPETFAGTNKNALLGPGEQAGLAYYVLADAGMKAEAAKAVEAGKKLLGGLTPEDFKPPDDQSKIIMANVAARFLLILAENKVPADELRKLADPLFQAIIKGYGQSWKRRWCDLWFPCLGPVETLYWSAYLTDGEKARLKDTIYAGLPTNNGSNNNGRWGWILDWQAALAFEDAVIMQAVIRTWEHWFGFNLYPAGVSQDWESYDYCTAGKEQSFKGMEPFLEGMDFKTYRAPQYPVVDSTIRFGFEDDRDPRQVPGAIWKDWELFGKRWSNHHAPDDILLGINDTEPALMWSGVRTNAQNMTVKSLNLTSSAVLRGGAAADAELWGNTAIATNPGVIGQMFWAYLHADPSDAIHNNYDCNQLLMWWNGKHLAGDAGCDCSADSGIYNRKNGLYGMYTYSHNTVTVDQKPQYISHGRVIDFVNTPGFRLATTDAGYIYDGVFHQRTIAMLPEYLVDLNLLPARDPASTNAHTFDCMMLGTGELANNDKFADYLPERLWNAQFETEAAHLRWPNLLHIYPYIMWGRARAPSNDWEVTWGEDDRNMRMIVTGLTNESRKAALGRAQLAHRGVANRGTSANFKRLVNGVPKVLERREGPSATFLNIFEPHAGQSAIKSWKRVDERGIEVELTSGQKDLVLLRRKAPEHAWIRYASKTAAEARLHKLGLANAKNLKLGDLVVMEADQPLAALLVEYPQAGQPLAIYAVADAPTTLKLALPQAPQSVDALGTGLKHSFANNLLTLSLPAGISRARLTFAGDPAVMVKAASLEAAGLAQQLALGEVKETYAEDAKLNQSKMTAEFQYKRPRVYGDGAYYGMKNVAPWTVAISDDGALAVAGTHEMFLEAFAGQDRLWRAYLKGNCLVDYNVTFGGFGCFGHLGNPLAMAGDGSRIYAGTDSSEAPDIVRPWGMTKKSFGHTGYLHCLDRAGNILWIAPVSARVQSTATCADGSRVAAGAGTNLYLFGADGKPIFTTSVGNTVVIDVLLARDGKRLFYTCQDGSLTCLDETGQQLWQYKPALADTGGAGFYRIGKFLSDIAVDAAGENLAACGLDYGVYLFDAKTGKLKWRKEAECAQSNIAIADDGKTIASIADGEIYLYDGGGRVLWKFNAAFFGYNSMRMSRDGKYIAAVNPTGEWFLLGRDKKILNRTPLATPEPNALAMTPDGKRVIIGGIGYDVYIFDNDLK